MNFGFVKHFLLKEEAEATGNYLKRLGVISDFWLEFDDVRGRGFDLWSK